MSHTTRRYHSLDNLRAYLMLLGIVFHSALSYIPDAELGLWPIRDPNTNILFGILNALIHSFRMPAFFLVSGFFAALLYYRQGRNAMLKNRVKRILIPFIAAWIILNPIIVLVSHMAIDFSAGAKNVGTADTPEHYYEYLYHLWFLYNLMIFYGLTLLTFQLINLIPSKLADQLRIQFKRIGSRSLASWQVILLLSLISFVTLTPMQNPTFESSFGFVPSLRSLIAYGFFYCIGWALYINRHQIDQFKARAWHYTFIGTALFIVYLVFYALHNSQPTDVAISQFAKGLLGLISWSFIYALIGLFARYLDKPSKQLKYISDASYWIYLVHLPLTRLIPVLFIAYDWPAAIKFSFVVMLTFGICLASYHLFVRSTIIGYALNGHNGTKIKQNNHTNLHTDTTPRTHQRSRRIIPR